MEFFPKFDGAYDKKKKLSKTIRPWVKNTNTNQESHKLKQPIATEERSYKAFRHVKNLFIQRF